MITPQDLAGGYALNVRLVRMQTNGLSHADSLVQTPYNINSLNWVLGHLAVNRDRVLVLLGQEPLLSPEERGRYETGSDPVKDDGEGILPLERLLELLARGQETIDEVMPQLTATELDREIQVGEHTTTVGKRLYGLYFHDTYHTGQTDLLRQVAGKNDRVI